MKELLIYTHRADALVQILRRREICFLRDEDGNGVTRIRVDPRMFLRLLSAYGALVLKEG